MRYRAIPGLAALILAGSALLVAPVPAGAAELPATSAPAVAADFTEGGTPMSTVYYRGPAGDVLYRRVPGGVFDKAFSLGGRILGAPAAAGIFWTANSFRTEVAARGTDNALWYRERVGTGATGGFGPWRSLGGRLISAPAVAGGGLVADFYVVGTDHAVWTKRIGNVPGGQTAWRSLGGRVLAGTGPAAWGSGNVQRSIYVIGTDHQLYALNGTRWSKVPTEPPASQHPQYTADSPALAQAVNVQGAWVFFRNQVNNRLTLLSMCCGEEAYVDMEGRLTSGPGAVYLLPGAPGTFTGVDVAVRGTDNKIWMRQYRGGTWSPWRSW